ncbi:lactonase family protein [Fulvivirga sp. M361]|uniref:lactonase family protein n=1 Tax=Fulvivirga sp. M361 TaxID=2594266 RepID=UPI00117B45E5|nr:lactonase family protein [Fulvivirga sp. M361]TRX60045.1 lactonase family protein [Fulvivirga sp. M361]
MKLYIGCYTKQITEELVGKGDGIYVLDFNPSDGSIRYSDCIPATNPSYLNISSDCKILFALEENPIEEWPKVCSYRIGEASEDRHLELINKQELPGSFACHLSPSKSGNHLIVGAYMSGNILVYPITSEGCIEPYIHNVTHKGNGPNKIRQEAPHVHFVCPNDIGQFYAVDLGTDMVKSYRFTDDWIKEQPEENIQVDTGAGPRHMVISPSGEYIFVFSELDAKIHSYKKSNGKFECLESVATLPKDFKGVPSGAAIRMHPNGRFIYVSNREYNGITILSFDKISEKIVLIGFVSSGGKTPRDMNIDPDGNWLICANQDSDNLIVFRIHQTSGRLSQISVNEEIKTPSCVLFGK